MGRLRPRPTDSELAILRVLWERGPSTVRQVHEVIAGDTGYTTTLKLMQIMADKGLVTRNEESRTHIYKAMAGEEQTQNELVKDLVDRAFGGSAATLVMRAISANTSDEELREIRKLIDDYREKK
jgi:predicted transcriptional regulator